MRRDNTAVLRASVWNVLLFHTLAATSHASVSFVRPTSCPGMSRGPCGGSWALAGVGDVFQRRWGAAELQGLNGGDGVSLRLRGGQGEDGGGAEVAEEEKKGPISIYEELKTKRCRGSRLEPT
ncbi:hypothetical protein T484DRAFT_3582764 [Baffinella frigidus]|nr:hypothetical protein T484DRAFT_3582764 [Cryptophyta sp. CCMP2293]